MEWNYAKKDTYFQRRLIIFFVPIICFLVLIYVKIEDFLEKVNAHSNSILYFTDSEPYYLMFMIVAGIIAYGLIMYLRLKKAPKKAYLFFGIFPIFLLAFSVYGVANTYEDCTDEGIYVKSILSSEKFYSFSDISKIETYCYSKSKRRSSDRYYGMKYNVEFNDGYTIEAYSKIKKVDFPKLYKLHEIWVDQDKIPYYSTGINDKFLDKVIENQDFSKNKKLIKKMFSDSNQINMTSPSE